MAKPKKASKFKTPVRAKAAKRAVASRPVKSKAAAKGKVSKVKQRRLVKQQVKTTLLKAKARKKKLEGSRDPDKSINKLIENRTVSFLFVSKFGQSFAKQFNAKASNTIEKDTKLLVLGEGADSFFNSWIKDAKKLGIRIIDEAKWLNIAGAKKVVEKIRNSKNPKVLEKGEIVTNNDKVAYICALTNNPDKIVSDDIADLVFPESNTAGGMHPPRSFDDTLFCEENINFSDGAVITQLCIENKKTLTKIVDKHFDALLVHEAGGLFVIKKKELLKRLSEFSHLKVLEIDNRA